MVFVLFSYFEKLHKVAVFENCCQKTITTKVSGFCAVYWNNLQKLMFFPLSLFFVFVNDFAC